MEEFNSQETQSQNSILNRILLNTHLLLVIIIVTLLIIGSYIYIRWTKNQDQKYTESEDVFLDAGSSSIETRFSQEAENYEMLGSIYVYTKTPSVNINDTVEAMVVLNSHNIDITGFDVVVTYDPKVLKFLDIGSFFTKRIDLVYQDNNGVITISAVKKLSDKDQLIFNDDDVLVLRFQALEPAETTVSVAKSSEFGLTQFVDSQNKVFSPNVSGFSLKVE